MEAAFIENFILLEFVAFIWVETSSRHHERLLWLSSLPQFPLLFSLILVNPVAELLEKPKNPAVETWLLAKKQDYARERDWLEWSCHGVGTIENTPVNRLGFFGGPMTPILSSPDGSPTPVLVVFWWVPGEGVLCWLIWISALVLGPGFSDILLLCS